MRNERNGIDLSGLNQIDKAKNKQARVIDEGKITNAHLESWGACKRDADYSVEGIKGLTGGDGTSPRGVLDLDIPARDKVWVLLRPEVLGEAYGAIKKKAFPREKGAGIDYDKILAIIAEHI